MLLTMRAELLYFGLSIGLGYVMSRLAKGIGILHKKGGTPIWLGCLDVIYWLLAGVILFLLCFHRNDGILRGYAAVGTLIGWNLKLPLRKT